MQKGFVFDINKCTGCEACRVACSIENRLDPGVAWRRVYTFNPQRFPGVPNFHHSLACNHCADPPCLKYCPALAYGKDPDTGAVTVDPDKCIGCKYCSWACPYDAPRFSPSTGIVEKCTFCIHRLESGLEPACVSLCPTGALGFEDHDISVGTEHVSGFTASEIGPAVRFVPLRDQHAFPVCSTGNKLTKEPATSGSDGARIGLRSEWTLAAFTFLAAILVGSYTASLLPPASGTVDIPPIVFAGAGASGLAISTFHLGRRGRAWRAALNWRRSWLSREVLLFTVFLAAAMLSILSVGGDTVEWLIAATGFASLFAMDRVYHVTRDKTLGTHSAQVLLTGVMVAGLFSANAIIFGLIALVKTVLYLRRKYGFAKQNKISTAWLTRGRVLVGVVLPLAMWSTGSPALIPGIVAGVLIGESIDRLEFYSELEAPAPASQMGSDLAALWRGKSKA